MEPVSVWFWVGFHVFVVAMLAIDLGVFQREKHKVSVKEGSIWTAVWIGLSLLFCLGLYFWQGQGPALQFLTAYVIEKSLSVDNIFVFVVIFNYFSVPDEYQHETLFWGVLGAMIMRAVFIVLGVALLSTFHWVIYIFGAFLVYTGVRLAFQGDEEVHPEENPIINAFRRFFPVTENYVEGKFFVRRNGALMATPLFLVLLMIESTDVLFAVDSVPAVLSITQNIFIAYTSNIMAILGLRALYFVLAGVVDKFEYLHYGLAVVLTFVGVKMLTSGFFHIPTGVSLAVILGILTISIIASLLHNRRGGSEAKA